MTIGNPPITYVDGGMGYNNPVQALREEASHIWPDREIGCIQSIGTGMATTKDVGRSLKPLVETMKDMSTDTERIAREVKAEMELRKEKSGQDIYFRFNVQHGLQDVGLEEWKEMNRVKVETEDYLDEHWNTVKQCASRLVSSNCTLSQS